MKMAFIILLGFATGMMFMTGFDALHEGEYGSGFLRFISSAMFLTLAILYALNI